MAKIEVRHSAIVINDYTLGDCPRLEKIFSLWDSITHSHEMKVLHYDQEERKLYVPRGSDIYFIEQLIGCNAVIIKDHDTCQKLPPILLRYMPRDDVQKRALAFMLGMKEYEFTKAKSQLSVNLIMGKGKTYCSIAASSMLLMRTAILTSSVGWLEQWRDCILEYTDTKPSEIFMLIGGGSIYKLLKNDDYKKYKYILISQATIRSYANANGWNKVRDLFKYLKIGVKIFDECHLNFDNMCMIDYYSNVYKTYYVSGTPARSDKEEDRLFEYYFKSVPAVNLFDEEQDPHTRYIALKYNSKPSPMDITNCKNMKGFQKNSYASYITKQPVFYRVLDIILELALNNKGKNLFFIAKIEAMEEVRDYIINKYPFLRNEIGLYHSNIDKNIKESQLNKRIILSTIKSLGTAQDIKGLKMTVVLAEPFASEVLAKQSLYRTRDKNTVYLDCIDTGFNSISRYYTSKLPIFKKYALSCHVLNLSPDNITIKQLTAVEKINSLYCPILIKDPSKQLIEPIIIHPKE